MGTTQSSIARLEGGGMNPTVDYLRRLAKAFDGELVLSPSQCTSVAVRMNVERLSELRTKIRT